MATLRSLTLITWYQAGAVLLASLASLAWSPTRALAALVGGALMTANFWALRVLAARALLGARPKLAAGIALVAKFAVIAGAMAVCILVLHLDLLGFAIGMSSLFIGIAAATVHGAFASGVAPDRAT